MVVRSHSPYLFLLGELSGENRQALFDPIKKKVIELNIPQLSSQIECLSSRYGWLLLLSREDSSLFFFNPLLWETIHLPYHRSTIQTAIFSAPPTSLDCVVYLIHSVPFMGQIHVSTLHIRRQRSWSHQIYTSPTIKVNSNQVIQAAFNKDTLYCLDSVGQLIEFDEKNYVWRVVAYSKNSEHVKKPHLLEYEGEIYAGLRGSYGSVEKICKLKIGGDGVAEWGEVKDMSEGMCLFLGSHGGCVEFYDGVVKNKVFVANDGPQYKCVVCDFSDGDLEEIGRQSLLNFGWSYAPVWLMPSI